MSFTKSLGKGPFDITFLLGFLVNSNHHHQRSNLQSQCLSFSIRKVQALPFAFSIQCATISEDFRFTIANSSEMAAIYPSWFFSSAGAKQFLPPGCWSIDFGATSCVLSFPLFGSKVPLLFFQMLSIQSRFFAQLLHNAIGQVAVI